MTWTFLAFVAVNAALFRLMPWRIWSGWGILASNLAFLFLVEWGRGQTLIPLAAFLLLAYVLVRVVERSPNRVVFVVSLTAATTAFFYVKQYGLVHFIPTGEAAFFAVGASYVFFRIVHLLVDVQDREIRGVRGRDFLNYVIYSMSYYAGPIERYQDFQAQVTAPEAPVRIWVEDGRHFMRLIKGVVKVGLFAEGFRTAHQLMVQQERLLFSSLIFCALGTLVYLFYLYLNFSGYVDMAIGAAYLSGIRLSENFDSPLGAKSLMEFWTRWHMTLSDWIKTYLFNPLMKVLMGAGNMRYLPYWGVAAYFVCFLGVGIWHGASWPAVWLGVALATGISANKLYEVLFKTIAGNRRYEQFHRNPWVEDIWCGITLSCIAVSLVCLWMDEAMLTRFAETLGVKIIVVWIVAAMLYALMRSVVRLFRTLTANWLTTGDRPQIRRAIELLRLGVLGGLFVATLFYIHGNTPEIVYQRF